MKRIVSHYLVALATIVTCSFTAPAHADAAHPVVALLPGVTDRIHARFVRHLLDGRAVVRPNDMGHDQRRNGETHQDDEVNQDRVVGFQIKGWLCHEPTPQTL